MTEFYLLVLAVLHGGHILARELIKQPKLCKAVCISAEVLIVVVYLGGFYMLTSITAVSA